MYRPAVLMQASLPEVPSKASTDQSGRAEQESRGSNRAKAGETMACCLICVKDDPVPGSKLDAYYGNPNQFQIGMMEAPCKNCPWFCFGCLCTCCAQFIVRKRALDGNLENYLCCQGYYPMCCMSAGDCGERSCPCFCLCLESFCCNSCAVSSSRMYLMDKFSVMPDPWDNRIIRFNNFLQLLSCICNVAAMCIAEIRELAKIIDAIAHIVYMTTVGCMTGQMMYEMEYQASVAPKAQAIAGR